MSARDTSGSAPQHSHPHNNTMSRNEKFWVDQVTGPPPPGERQGVGNDKGGGGCVGEEWPWCMGYGTQLWEQVVFYKGHSQREMGS